MHVTSKFMLLGYISERDSSQIDAKFDTSVPRNGSNVFEVTWRPTGLSKWLQRDTTNGNKKDTVHDKLERNTHATYKFAYIGMLAILANFTELDIIERDITLRILSDC